MLVAWPATRSERFVIAAAGRASPFVNGGASAIRPAVALGASASKLIGRGPIPLQPMTVEEPGGPRVGVLHRAALGQGAAETRAILGRPRRVRSAGPCLARAAQVDDVGCHGFLRKASIETTLVSP